MLLGGLTPADISSNEIVTATRAGSQRIGRIPRALHDSAAVKIGGRTYLFGGGTGVSEIDTILMVDPRTGAAQPIGRLPAPTTHAAAAAVGTTAFVVGGRGAAVGTPTDRIVAVDPLKRTVRVAGTKAYTASLAVPFSSEPPAITTRPAAAVTAAYRKVCGRCATTRALPLGLQATIVSSQRVPV